MYDYAAADRVIQFARADNQKVRGHVLVWHSQNSAWPTEDAFTPPQLREILRKHVTETLPAVPARLTAPQIRWRPGCSRRSV